MALFRQSREIYLDYAASTPVCIEALKAMEPYWKEVFANPFSRHSMGKKALSAVTDTRKRIADSLGARTSEIHFTSGATEGNVFAIRGVIEREGSQGSNIIVSNIEHASLHGVEEYARRFGVEVRELVVGTDGVIDISQLKELVDEKTILVSVVYVNSEIGTIQPIRTIANYLKGLKNRPLLHTDASQAPLWVDVNMSRLGVDLATFDSQKIYGPKGVGFLYIRTGVEIESIFFSSRKEKLVRPGTVPVPLVVGLGVALARAVSGREARVKRVQALRNYFIDRLEDTFEGVSLNGSRELRVANNVSITFDGANHEYLRVLLDTRGVMCSTGSACVSHEEVVSSVVALKSGHTEALRFSLGEETTRRDIDRAVGILSSLRETGLV